MNEAENKNMKPSNLSGWVESLSDFNQEDWSTFDTLIARSISASKRLISKNENEDFFQDMVMNFY